jgi:ubiquinone/menaquinone biosynthesis C-methylase UbiE
MIAEADRRAQAADVSQRPRHEVCDVTRGLPFSEASFDSCRSERLFQHLRDPEQALAEMVRVTKPGGWIVVLDTDHASKSFDSSEVDIERRLSRFTAERYHVNGFSGRRLYGQFPRQGLVKLWAEAVAIAFTDLAVARQANCFDMVEEQALREGVITPAELERWRASLQEAASRGEFFGTGTGGLVAGRKPPVADG